MKYSFTLILFVLSIIAFAQQVDYNKIILPSDAEDISIEERLVRLAWKNLPSNLIYAKNIDNARKELQLNKWSWLDNFGFVANLNEFNLNPSSDIANRSQYFPRYNVSFRISLGQFIDIPLQNRMYKDNLDIEKLQMNDRKLEIRAEVLKQYEIYKNALEVVNIQNEILEDSQSAFAYFEEQFKNGEISFEKYNDERIVYNRNRLNNLNAKRELEIAEIDIERLIGVELEEVIN